jgi:hypothetical protein
MKTAEALLSSTKRVDVGHWHRADVTLALANVRC